MEKKAKQTSTQAETKHAAEQYASAEQELTGPAAAEEPEKQPAVEMVTISAEEYAALLENQKTLEQAKKQAAEFFEGWQRERADFNNYKRRIERDQVQLTQSTAGNIMKKYLPPLDDMERALKTRPVGSDGAAWADGIELIYQKLRSILESEGLQSIAKEADEFDPMRHEAISHEDSPDHESGQIIEVVQQGYTIGDRVLRPALVRVAR